MIITLNQFLSLSTAVTFKSSKRTADSFRVVPTGDDRHRSYIVNYDSTLPQGEMHEALRCAAAKLCGQACAEKHTRVQLEARTMDSAALLAFVDGLQLANYSFDRYKSKTPIHLTHLNIVSSKLKQAQLDEQLHLWNRLFWCREWVNLPVADLNAPRFADELKAVADDLHVRCEVFDKKAIEAMGMGGLLAVNKGSVDEPRLVVLEYNGQSDIRTSGYSDNPSRPKNRSVRKTERPICLVGKGIMYDTGGLNIKPNDYMQEMKSDMAGAATMASVVFAAADNALPIHLVAVLPLTDNRPGFNAYAADDILTMYDGTTVEVVNTDAEGRLILADALAYTVKRFNPSLLIDAATLTGAAVRAIGTYGIAAVQQHADKEMRRLKGVGESVHQRIAELPFWNEYDELIKSDFADIKNCGPGNAGTITAGKFLAHFVETTPYIHLDIAGVAYFTKAQVPYGTGASGYGLRLLYDFMKK